MFDWRTEVLIERVEVIGPRTQVVGTYLLL